MTDGAPPVARVPDSEVTVLTSGEGQMQSEFKANDLRRSFRTDAFRMFFFPHHTHTQGRARCLAGERAAYGSKG